MYDRAGGQCWLVSIYVRVLIALTAAACGPKQVAPTDEVHWPAIVDSHVHLAYSPVGPALRRHGVETVVDLAAPEATLGAASPIDVIGAGPMLTHPGGYPLDAWGRDGYGLGCADAACVTAAVERLISHGARVIKIAGDDDGLAPALMPVAVRAAHAHHVNVVIHALSDAGALAGGRAGCDVLAHTPAEALSDATIDAWRGRAVISTLAAFGAPAAVDNLRRLRAAGLTILYGTDLGNLAVEGPSREEVALLREAGLDDAAITAAMTTTPRAFWGIPDAPDTYLVLRADPRREAGALLAPVDVIVHGKSVK